MDIPSIITPRIPRSYRRGSVHFLSFAPRVVSHKCLERGPRLKKSVMEGLKLFGQMIMCTLILNIKLGLKGDFDNKGFEKFTY